MSEFGIRDLLIAMTKNDATDLLLSVGKPPQIRVSKNLINLGDTKLTPDRTKELCYQVMNEMQQKKLEDEWEVDFSIGIPQLARFRVNVFMQRSSVSAAFRRIPFSLLKKNSLLCDVQSCYSVSINLTRERDKFK